VPWNFNDKQLQSVVIKFLVIIVNIYVFFVVEVWICVKLYVVLVVILDLMMHRCRRMYVDVNEDTFFPEKKQQLSFILHISHTRTQCLLMSRNAICTSLQYAIVLNGYHSVHCSAPAGGSSGHSPDSMVRLCRETLERHQRIVDGVTHC